MEIARTMPDNRTNATVALLAEELRKRRVQIDGAPRLRSIEMKIEYDSAGDITGFKIALHESSRVNVTVDNGGAA